jgi:DNA polymerase III subunit delta
MNKKTEQKSNLYLFTGENLIELNRKLCHWKSEFKKKHQDINLEQYSGISQDDLKTIITALESAPFLSDKRMIIIKGVPQSAADKKEIEFDTLIEAISDLSEDVVLIFASPKPDKRSKLYKTLMNIAQVKEFAILKGQELAQWIYTEVKNRGGGISIMTAKNLMGYCGEDMTTISHEIDKLILYKKKEEIVMNDVFNVCTMHPLSNIFAFTGGIGGDKRKMLLMLQKLIQSGEAIQLIFFMIVRQFRYLIQVRYLLDHHKSKAEIQSQLKLAPFQVSQYINQSRNWSYQQLKEIYTELKEMDIKVKVGKIPSTTDTQHIFQLYIEKFLLCITSPN